MNVVTRAATGPCRTKHTGPGGGIAVILAVTALLAVEHAIRTRLGQA
jgi:hypothetical protein